MEKLLKESYLYHLIFVFSCWIKKLFQNSYLIGLFLKEKDTSKRNENSLFAKFFRGIINALQKFAHIIKLDKLFENSIFAKPMIWLCITIFLVPLMPTMVDLMLVALTATSLFLKILITPDFKFQYHRMNIWILFFILVVCVSAVTSVSMEESRNIALLISAFTISYFLIINIVESKRELKLILYLLIVSCVMTAIFGIYQYIFGDVYSQAWLDSNMFEDIKMRVYSTFENPNVYGEYLILVIPIIVALFFTEKGFWKKMFLIVSFGITMLALILTFSRGCWLGIILALGILLLVIDKRFIWLGVAGLVVLPFVLPETIMNRFLSIGNMGDSSTSYRVYIWLGTLAMLKDYWFSGIGLGITSFNAIYPIYSYHNVSAPHSHNLFLQFMVEYGIVGLVVFLGIIYHFYKETIIQMVKEKNLVIASIISGMTGYFLQSLFDNTWYNYRVILIFWIVLALGMVATRIQKKGI